jgi:hypothetical protein
MRLSHTLAICGLSVAALTASAIASAEARIRCDGEFQVNSGQRIATPYCEDSYLAQVARSYGSRVSAAQLRNSVFEKTRVCRFVGADIRVRSICDPYRGDFRDR